MDKRWKNFGIILIILIILIVLFSAFNIVPGLNPFVLDNKVPEPSNSLENAFLELAELSENKGVDFNNLVYGTLITFDSNFGYKYSRKELLDFNLDIESILLKKEKELSNNEFEYFSDVISLLQYKIYLYDAYFGVIYFSENVDLSLFCQKLNEMNYDLIPQIDFVFEIYETFNNKTINLSKKYNSPVLLVNGEFEQHEDFLFNLTENLDEAIGICLEDYNE